MTGFRVALGGAQQRYGITARLDHAGQNHRRRVADRRLRRARGHHEQVAPVGPVYQAGTLSGNPLAVAAGLAMLRHLKAHPEIYDELEAPRPSPAPRPRA